MGPSMRQSELEMEKLPAAGRGSPRVFVSENSGAVFVTTVFAPCGIPAPVLTELQREGGKDLALK